MEEKVVWLEGVSSVKAALYILLRFIDVASTIARNR